MNMVIYQRIMTIIACLINPFAAQMYIFPACFCTVASNTSIGSPMWIGNILYFNLTLFNPAFYFFGCRKRDTFLCG